MALTANRPPDSVPVDKEAVAKDIDALFEAGQGKSGTDEVISHSQLSLFYGTLTVSYHTDGLL